MHKIYHRPEYSEKLTDKCTAINENEHFLHHIQCMLEACVLTKFINLATTCSVDMHKVWLHYLFIYTQMSS